MMRRSGSPGLSPALFNATAYRISLAPLFGIAENLYLFTSSHSTKATCSSCSEGIKDFITFLLTGFTSIIDPGMALDTEEGGLLFVVEEFWT